MANLEISVLGSSVLKNGVAKWQSNVPVGNDNDDVTPHGEIQVFQSLGVSSLPFPKTDAGKCEAVTARDVSGRTVIALGGRDTRNADFLGKMSPGDTSIHATGEGAVAQAFFKNEKRSAGLATEDSASETMTILLDGKNDKLQIAARGATIQIDELGDISILNSAGHGFLIQDNGVHVKGTFHLPGIPPGFGLGLVPIPAGSPPGAGALLILPLKGVTG